MIILQAIYLMLPAYVANMSPVFLRQLSFLGGPVDFGHSLGGRRIFGDHKTIRGVVSGVIFGIIIVWLQKYFSSAGAPLAILPYGDFSTTDVLLYGLALGGGALGGDLIKSFFKRRFGVEPGKSWPPFDQIDSAIGALVALSPLYIPSLKLVAIIVVVSGLLSVSTNIIGYGLGLRDTWR